jgi:soluble lytic murein transglycosylase-like protein
MVFGVVLGLFCYFTLFYASDFKVFQKTVNTFMRKEGLNTNDLLIHSIYNNSTKFKLNPYLIASICYAESEFYKYAVSECGAVGYMQLMIQFWGEKFNDTNISTLFDEQANIEVGCYVFRYYLAKCNGDEGAAIIRYNGGRAKQVGGKNGKVHVTPESYYYNQKIFRTLIKLNSIQSEIIKGVSR